MSVAVHSLEFDADAKDKPYFKLAISFTVDDNSKHLFSKFLAWWPVRYITNPTKYEEESEALKMTFGERRPDGLTPLNFVGPDRTEVFKSGFIVGYDAIYEQDGKYIFNDVFTTSPVTLAIIEELVKIKENSNHTSSSNFSPAPEAYLAILLECLHLHWN